MGDGYMSFIKIIERAVSAGAAAPWAKPPASPQGRLAESVL